VKITFLGTGTSQGIPIIACSCKVCTSADFRDQRLRTSIMVSIENTNLVIDTGPDFRQQMLRENVQQLDAVLFTHEHKDHIAGLDDVRGFNYAQQKAMPIYASAQVVDALKREFAYVFADYQYPGIPQLHIHELQQSAFEINGISIQPIEVMHYKLPVLGFRIQDFTYITDANYISKAEKEKIKGSKVIVLNALQKEHHVSHYTLEQAIALIQELQPEKAYFTHLSHRMGTHAETSKLLPDNIAIAYDGLSITL
jgi:phosphoribosyl 1,2-cyclic phosphate phosphodiesterase